jgi:hypothetical protein
MSGFLLDTNIPSEMLRPRPDANVAESCQPRLIRQAGTPDSRLVNTSALLGSNGLILPL